jgi:hypothetical protein
VLVRRAFTLAPDNAHQTPLGYREDCGRGWSAPAGSAAQGPGQQVSPVTPRTPGLPRRYFVG